MTVAGERQDFAQAYQTSDFEFVVACMSLPDYRLRVLGMTPAPAGKRKLDQVVMHLALVDEEGRPDPDTRRVMDRLRARYQNREAFVVDPRTLYENQRTLRANVHDAVDRFRQGRVTAAV